MADLKAQGLIRAIGMSHKTIAGDRAQPASSNRVADHPGVSSIVVGTLNPDHLVENARSLHG